MCRKVSGTFGTWQRVGEFPALGKSIFSFLLYHRYNYVGTSRSTVIQNQDVVKELQVGMLIAIAGNNFPKVGKVMAIPPNPSLDSNISIEWMVQERATHKPKWQRSLKLGAKSVLEGTQLRNVLFYGFQLTNKGCLKKKSREHLKYLMKFVLLAMIFL